MTSGDNPLYDDPIGFPPPASKKNAAKEHVHSFALIVFLPWCMFTLVMCLFAFAYEDHKRLVWALVLMFLLSALLFVAHGPGMARSPHVALGLLCLAAVITSGVISWAILREWLYEFWRLENGATYLNLSPSSKGADHADATSIGFNLDSKIDNERSLGYMEAGEVYCVAPVSGEKYSNSPQFWAIGKNCCDQRAGFRCEDASLDEARSGLVMGGKDPERDKFVSAVRMAQAVYSLDTTDPSSDGTLFMHWYKDPDEAMNDIWLSALLTIILASLGYLLASMAAAYLLRRRHILISKTLDHE